MLNWPHEIDSVVEHCRLPDLRYQRTKLNQAIMKACPSLSSMYSACPFLTNCHVETIFAALFRRDPGVSAAAHAPSLHGEGTHLI